MSLRLTAAQLAALQAGGVEPTTKRRQTNYRHRPAPGCIYWPMGAALTPPAPCEECWELGAQVNEALRALREHQEGAHHAL